MEHDQQSDLSAMHRTKWFLDTNKAALKMTSQAPARATFDAILASLVDHVAVQHSAEANATSLTRQKDALREELRLQHMQPVAVIARAQLSGTTAIADLRIPDRRTKDGDLVAAGHGMVKAATPYKQLFLDAMLPADFIESLQAAADRFRDAITDRDGARVLLHQATDGVKRELTRARAVVRILNAFIVQDLKTEPSLLAGWVMAKRTTLKPGVPRGTVNTPVPRADAA